jgi:hypothetical protein
MREALRALLTSKKALATIASLLVIVCGKLGWDVSEADLLAWISPLLAFIVAQGIADVNKEATKMEITADEKKGSGNV